MTKLEFKLQPHSTRECEVIEIFLNGKFVATITPGESPNSFRVISNHMKSLKFERATLSIPEGLQVFEFCTLNL